MSDWSAHMAPQKATLDSKRTLSSFVGTYQFQFSLSATALGMYLYDNRTFSHLGDHELQEHIVEDPGDFVAVVLPALCRLGRNDRQDRRSTHGTIT